MTMRELARLANVSASAVSKAFHQAEDISEETRQHIFAVAKEYGCYGQFFKGKYPKPVIAIICPEFKSNFYSIYIETLQKIIEEHHAIPLVLSDNFNEETQAELLEYFSAYLQVDGILVFGLKNTLKKGFDTPLVSLFGSVDQRVDAVAMDIVPAIEEAVATLRSMGHHHIAIAAEEKTHSRVRRLCGALGISDQSKDVFISKQRFEQAGEECAKQILASPTPYTAVLCSYDNIALGVMKHLSQQGYGIPADFSIVGINNIPFSQYTKPSLSTINEHIEEACTAAWELLEQKMKNIHYHPQAPIRLQATFLQRESIGKARNPKE